MRALDLNADAGESFGPYRLGCDEALMPHVTSVNIACGFHAGDPAVMARTVRLALAAGVQIGAHPGYPDLQGFGRRELRVPPDEIGHMIVYQTGALAAIVHAESGMRLHHVKLHGALYHAAASQQAVAAAVTDALLRCDPSLILYAPPVGVLAPEAARAGLTVWSEVFADRAYAADGRLVARDRPGAVLSDPEEMAARVLRMCETGQAAAVDGSMLSFNPDTVCVHGDGPGAAQAARRIRQVLAHAGCLMGEKN